MKRMVCVCSKNTLLYRSNWLNWSGAVYQNFWWNNFFFVQWSRTSDFLLTERFSPSFFTFRWLCLIGVIFTIFFWICFTSPRVCICICVCIKLSQVNKNLKHSKPKFVFHFVQCQLFYWQVKSVSFPFELCFDWNTKTKWNKIKKSRAIENSRQFFDKSINDNNNNKRILNNVHFEAAQTKTLWSTIAEKDREWRIYHQRRTVFVADAERIYC